MKFHLHMYHLKAFYLLFPKQSVFFSLSYLLVRD